jgi:hypothetical protein
MRFSSAFPLRAMDLRQIFFRTIQYEQVQRTAQRYPQVVS